LRNEPTTAPKTAAKTSRDTSIVDNHLLIVENNPLPL
jgi:hypothetical protein